MGESGSSIGGVFAGVRKELKYKQVVEKIKWEVIGLLPKNLSHSGINFKDLKKEFEQFKKIPFPEPPIADALYDIFSELVELDGYIAGIVSSLLDGKKIERKMVYVDEDLNEKLNSFCPNSDEAQKELGILIEYKKNLDKLIKLALLLY